MLEITKWIVQSIPNDVLGLFQENSNTDLFGSHAPKSDISNGQKMVPIVKVSVL